MCVLCVCVCVCVCPVSVVVTEGDAACWVVDTNVG